jgi:phospho-N-acetylmuramoyl-pentapeptide-transferase
VVGYVAVHNTLTSVQFSRAGILVVGTMVGLGLVGFLDDWLKIRNHRSLGLTKTAKFAGQALCAGGLALGAWYWAGAWRGLSFIRPIGGTELFLILFIAWVFLIVAGASNAVNRTDGMDGLASGSTVLVMSAYVVIAFWQFRHSCAAEPLNSVGCYMIDTAEAHDIAVAAAAMMGACAGFLWWNAPPAQIFMGDTGSLAIGAGLATLGLALNVQLLLPIVGALFVFETLSVIVQVGSFRLFHRRVLRMAPVHHHFELGGWPETTVIIRFWLISAICVAVALGIFISDFTRVSGDLNP